MLQELIFIFGSRRFCINIKNFKSKHIFWSDHKMVSAVYRIDDYASFFKRRKLLLQVARSKFASDIIRKTIKNFALFKWKFWCFFT